MFLSFIKNVKNVKVKFYSIFYSIKNLRIKFVTAFLLLQAGGAYAQDELLPSGLRGLMSSIQGIFTGPFVKGILMCSLAGCAIAYGFNKDNEKIKRNIIAVAVACAILITASEIIKRVSEAAGGK